MARIGVTRMSSGVSATSSQPSAVTYKTARRWISAGSSPRIISSSPSALNRWVIMGSPSVGGSGGAKIRAAGVGVEVRVQLASQATERGADLLTARAGLQAEHLVQLAAGAGRRSRAGDAGVGVRAVQLLTGPDRAAWGPHAGVGVAGRVGHGVLPGRVRGSVHDPRAAGQEAGDLYHGGPAVRADAPLLLLLVLGEEVVKDVAGGIGGGRRRVGQDAGGQVGQGVGQGP